MKIEIDLYSSTQLRAFATFMNALADENESQVADKMAAYISERALGSSINRDANPVWKNEGGPINSTDEPVDTVTGEAQEQGAIATRKRGEPSPGHKRRTKAEIAEDDAAAAAEFAPEARRLAAEGNAQFEADRQAAISTGGERVAPDDEPEVAEQDAADETAETAKAGAELSHDDVRGAMGKYVEKFGMDAAQIDLPKLFALALKNPEITKVSLIPGDQKSLKIVVDGVNEMLAKNPFSRDAVA